MRPFIHANPVQACHPLPGETFDPVSWEAVNPSHADPGNLGMYSTPPLPVYVSPTQALFTTPPPSVFGVSSSAGTFGPGNICHTTSRRIYARISCETFNSDSERRSNRPGEGGAAYGRPGDATELAAIDPTSGGLLRTFDPLHP